MRTQNKKYSCLAKSEETNNALYESNFQKRNILSLKQFYFNAKWFADFIVMNNKKVKHLLLPRKLKYTHYYQIEHDDCDKIICSKIM